MDDYYGDIYGDNCDNDELEDYPRQEFIRNVEEYIASINKYRDDHKDELDVYWRKDYDGILQEFQNIIAVAEYNWLEAKKILEGVECFRYENFTQYVYHHDMRNTTLIKGTDVRSKTLRRKRSSTCPKCKIECKPTKEMDTLKCPKCGYEIMKAKAGIPDNVINEEKHIRKHYDKLTGCSKIPASLYKLIPYLTIWLTEWKYVHAWLLFSDRYDTFVHNYCTRTGTFISPDEFDRVIERKQENKMEFSVYELLADEFYKMTELLNKLNRKSTNIAGKEEFIMDILEHYVETRPKYEDNIVFKSFYDIPEESVTFVYNGTEYSIGIYMNKLSMLYKYDEHNIKRKIVDRWCGGKDILIYPGLMFNFGELFTTAQNIPKSFIYSENYNKVMFEVFHTKFMGISMSDIKILIGIHLRFNDYYKQNVQKSGKKKNTKTNSPLFVVVFKCIVTTFKHFNKYIKVLDQVPHRITESATKNEIDNLWLQFITQPENHDLIELYDNDAVEPIVTSSSVVDEFQSESHQDDPDPSSFSITPNDADPPMFDIAPNDDGEINYNDLLL